MSETLTANPTEQMNLIGARAHADQLAAAHDEMGMAQLGMEVLYQHGNVGLNPAYFTAADKTPTGEIDSKAFMNRALDVAEVMQEHGVGPETTVEELRGLFSVMFEDGMKYKGTEGTEGYSDRKSWAKLAAAAAVWDKINANVATAQI